MDTSTFVFYHCDLGLTNLLVDISTGSLGIINWGLASYVPIEWVRTKFQLLSGIYFKYRDEDSKKDWRRRVAAHLERWATAMLWMHGGSFRTASWQWSITLSWITYIPLAFVHVSLFPSRPQTRGIKERRKSYHEMIWKVKHFPFAFMR
jgi:hypothetical protein